MKTRAEREKAKNLSTNGELYDIIVHIKEYKKTRLSAFREKRKTMKKKLITILTAAAALCALLCGAVLAGAEDGDAGDPALLMPTSYEQYLSLDAPTDFAVNERYIVIADKQGGSAVFYIYDKQSEAPSYTSYSYETSRDISSLNLYSCAEGDFLFYIETGNYICYFDLNAPERTEFTGLNASSMLIYDGGIYSAVQTGASCELRYTPLDGLTAGTSVIIEESLACANRPAFALYQETVYFAADTGVYQFNTSSLSAALFSVGRNITSFAMRGTTSADIVYCDNDGYLHVGSDEEGVRLNAGAIKSSAGTIEAENPENIFFVLCGTNISAYDAESASFVGYEIGKYSSATNRIGQSAADISANGDRLVIADTSNNRVLLAVKGEEDHSYTAIATDGTPTAVCAGDDGFAVALGRELLLYSYEGALLKQYAPLTTNVGSIAFSYGKYYVTADSQNVLYEFDPDADEPAAYAQTSELSGVTADIYGSLYVLSGGTNTAWRLNADFSAEADSALTVPADTRKILSDFDGNLYALANNAVYKLSAEGYGSALVSSNGADGSPNITELVNYDGTAAPIVSFAFDFESGEAYLLSDGFIASTDSLGIRSLDNLAAGGAYAEIFTDLPGETGAQSLQLVTVNAGAVTVALDLNELNESASALPYHGYEKASETKTGVVLAQTENGPIVAFYTREPEGEVNVRHTYEVKLVLGDESVTPVSSSEYLPDADITEGYAVSPVGLYRYPLMRMGTNGSFSDFRRMVELPRSSRLAVLAKISHAALDADYYYVSVTIDGTTRYGYVPANFVVEYEPTGGVSETAFRYARLDRNESATLTEIGGIETVLLENEEELKVFYERTDENGFVYAEYSKEDANGTVRTYAGYIDPDILYEATPSVLVTLVIVLVATATILVSVCYLILRKPPTLQ